jgi:hypothetical protein
VKPAAYITSFDVFGDGLVEAATTSFAGQLEKGADLHRFCDLLPLTLQPGQQRHNHIEFLQNFDTSQ